MHKLHKILNILADGRFHSGEAIGKQLGITRSAVWQQLKQLQGQIQINSLPNKGYQIPGGLDLLTKEKIVASIDQRYVKAIIDIIILDSVDSTNKHLEQLNPPSGTVCFAEHQTAGKGRIGRSWVTPYASQLAMSMVWDFVDGSRAMTGLSIAIGIALINSLSEYKLTDLKLKWPNDIYYQDKKIAGILTELKGDPNGPCRVIIGIGLNVSLNKSVIKDAIDQPWIDLESILNYKPDRNHLAGIMINSLTSMLFDFNTHGLASFKDKLSEIDLLHGKSIVIDMAGENIKGIGKGIDDLGRLCVETDDAMKTIISGTVRFAPV